MGEKKNSERIKDEDVMNTLSSESHEIEAATATAT